MNTRILAATTSIFLFAGPITDAYSASTDECAIWLCLPGGFPSGCAAAHAAMVKRLHKLKPPLPAFGSCTDDGSGDFTSSFNVAAYIPPHEECVEYGITEDGFGCVRTEWVGESWVSGVICGLSNDEDEAEGCTRTDYEVHIYENGRPFQGSPYHFSIGKD